MLSLLQLLHGAERISRIARSRIFFVPNPERDVFLVSYPRSGNTWMRAVIACIETGVVPQDLLALDYVVPDMHLKTLRNRMVPRPRYIVKSHSAWTESYTRVIYIAREPADVLLSYYAYRNALSQNKLSIDRFATEWLLGRIGPCSWREHVRSWTEQRTTAASDLLLLNYEHIQRDPGHTVVRIAQFLDADMPPERVHRILQATSRQAMRQMETKGDRASHRAAGLEFIGSGSIGSRGTLPPAVAQMVEDECRETWEKFVARCSAATNSC